MTKKLSKTDIYNEIVLTNKGQHLNKKTVLRVSEFIKKRPQDVDFILDALKPYLLGANEVNTKNLFEAICQSRPDKKSDFINALLESPNFTIQAHKILLISPNTSTFEQLLLISEKNGKKDELINQSLLKGLMCAKQYPNNFPNNTSMNNYLDCVTHLLLKNNIPLIVENQEILSGIVDLIFGDFLNYHKTVNIVNILEKNNYQLPPDKNADLIRFISDKFSELYMKPFDFNAMIDVVLCFTLKDGTNMEIDELNSLHHELKSSNYIKKLILTKIAQEQTPEKKEMKFKPKM